MTTETMLNITDHLNDFVEEATQEGISDIAFSPAGHPRARLNGVWKHYKAYHRLTEKDLLTIIANTHQSLNEEAKVRVALSEHQRLNYSTVIANWNFRINVGLSNGMPFLIMRVISREVPTIDDLGLLVQPRKRTCRRWKTP
ncbi:hypothetical protein [Deinococcus multiflagellatus]|uniref:Uncharacterized protein n=1 Tax=Deinococcus multiflagellatus TaxID=1656887 RepID=A0ABW1ZTH1_9DEIO